MSRRRVVTFGGGHGLAASLTALRMLDLDLTAVVTVADDGGSSGRLRQEFGVLPPGDLRMALAALCPNDERGRQWRDTLQHRFVGNGQLAGHVVGNLMLVALWERCEGDVVAALDAMTDLLACEGRVLPMAEVPLDIAAMVLGADPSAPDAITRVQGQVAAATTPGRVLGVELAPRRPPACLPAVAAVTAADWLILGPGSWFTSVLPHLLVPDLASAIVHSRARRLLALNLAQQDGETGGYTPEAHLEVLLAHAPDLRFDVVLADPTTVSDHGALVDVAAAMGARVEVADIALGDGTPRHDPHRFAQAFRSVLRE